MPCAVSPVYLASATRADLAPPCRLSHPGGNMPLPRLQWGLPDAVPLNATCAWGCRAIVTQDGYIDIVPDRVDRQGSTVIFDLLDSQFPPAKLTESLAAL